jgi:hypothetical protein
MLPTSVMTSQVLNERWFCWMKLGAWVSTQPQLTQPR